MREKYPVLAGMLDFVFPPLCAGCGRFDESAEGICESCRNAINTFSVPICLSCESVLAEDARCPVCNDRVFPLFALGNYKSPLREIIIQFKFRNVLGSVELLATQFANIYTSQLKKLSADCLVPVPLHPYREHRRGYNQACVVAEALVTHLELPVRTDFIKRTEKRRPQARLNYAQRVRNIKGVFSILQEKSAQERILLVDDVVTTGATVTEAKKVLEDAGHKVVGVIALAHGV
ncbi:MAG: ComF family protein [candidate division Zixibacteria bacterium]|nr:ComF family protein [candidate division Zixibacteria bacterium]